MRPELCYFALVSCVLLLLASPVMASEAVSAVAFGSYIDDFTAYWKEKALKQNTMVVAVLAVGAVAILIITRSKGPK